MSIRGANYNLTSVNAYIFSSEELGDSHELCGKLYYIINQTEAMSNCNLFLGLKRKCYTEYI
jgi:hypothetical protein